MRFPVEGHRFLGFFPPYRELDVLDHPYQIPRSPIPQRGSALLWNLRTRDLRAGARSVRARPPGVALIIVLPPTEELGNRDLLFRLMATCRPHSIIPHVEEIDPDELKAVLRRFPTQLALEVTEYLLWRGLDVDMDTRHLIRRTLDLSAELRTVSALARALYMSRRALGRRFMTRGLPVPSHWLHFGRVLRGSIKLQDPSTSLFTVGCELGYPDGFSFSNQLNRLIGVRPSVMRDCFGWEWIVESWLHRESEAGNLSPSLTRSLFPGRTREFRSVSAESSSDHASGGGRALRVAEDRTEK